MSRTGSRTRLLVVGSDATTAAGNAVLEGGSGRPCATIPKAFWGRPNAPQGGCEGPGHRARDRVAAARPTPGKASSTPSQPPFGWAEDCNQPDTKAVDTTGDCSKGSEFQC